LASCLDIQLLLSPSHNSTGLAGLPRLLAC